MDLSKRKELFSIAYITALAAQAGLNHSTPLVDDDSVDISLIGRNYKGLVRNPQIDIQLKCTSQDCFQDDNLKFDLKIKNYEDLRGDNVSSARYLMVLVVPDDVEDWAVLGANDLTLKHSFYWLSLRSKPATTNTKSVRLEIPVANKVTSEVLLYLMDMASRMEFV